MATVVLSLRAGARGESWSMPMAPRAMTGFESRGLSGIAVAPLSLSGKGLRSAKVSPPAPRARPEVVDKVAGPTNEGRSRGEDS